MSPCDGRVLAIADAMSCVPGAWQREVDRHQRTADRIRGLLDELGEPVQPDGQP